VAILRKHYALSFKRLVWSIQREMMRSRRYREQVRGEPHGGHEATLQRRINIIIEVDKDGCLRATDNPDPRSYTKDVDGVGVISSARTPDCASVCPSSSASSYSRIPHMPQLITTLDLTTVLAT
jgi:hypothetical protein